MTEFPSNSQRSRPVSDEKAKDVDDKKIEPISNIGQVRRRKRPLRKRFADVFIQTDPIAVVQYVWHEVLLPAAKDMLVDAGSEALHRSFYGEGGRAGRRASRSSAGYSTGTFVNYNRPGSSPLQRREEPRALSRKAKANHNFEELIFNTRVECDEVLDRLYDIISRYEAVSVKDLYEMLGLKPEYTDGNWGWTDLRGAGVTRLPSGGYLLDLPRPEPLD